MRNKYNFGFTIVELLIVIVVIAILAALAVVAYNGIQARAADSAVSANFTNAAKAVQLDKVTRSGYAPSETNFNNGNGFNDSGDVNILYAAPSTPQPFTTDYCLVGYSTKSRKVYVETSAGKQVLNNVTAGQTVCTTNDGTVNVQVDSINPTSISTMTVA